MSDSSVCRLLSRPVSVAVLGLLGAGNVVADESKLTVQNLTGGIITVVRTREAWLSGQGAYLRGRSAVRQHLQSGETASFSYQVAGKVVEGHLVIRALGENALVHHDGFTVRFLHPGGRIPAMGASSLMEELPAVPDEEADLDSE